MCHHVDAQIILAQKSLLADLTGVIPVTDVNQFVDSHVAFL